MTMNVPTAGAVARVWYVRVWNSEGLKWSLIATCLLLLLLQVWGLSLFGTHVDYERAGTLADWFTGLLTLGAVVVAAIALRSDRERYEMERLHADEMRASDERNSLDAMRLIKREAASRVYCWMTVRQDYTGQRIDAIELHLRNETAVPIYRWRVTIDNGLHTSCESIGPIVPGDATIVMRDDDWVANWVAGVSWRPELEFDASNGECLKRHRDGTVSVVRGEQEN